MHTAVVETVPTISLGVLAVTPQILLAVIVKNIVLARHEEYLSHLRASQNLVHRVELRRLRQMTQIARVQNERRRCRQRVDPRDGFLQCANHVFVRFLAESNVAVADLDKAQGPLALGCASAPLSALAPPVIWVMVSDRRTPPVTVNSTPVPTHAMHFKKPRRSMPSWL